MPATIAAIEAEALKLTPEERAHLADRLLASLSLDEEVEQAWHAEAERRLAELDRGAVTMVTVEAAVARARDAIR